ncbi:MAG: Ig-like domain-containing protein [Nevskiales bacterium]
MDGRPYIHRLGMLVLLAAALGLASCKSDNATRSPDLPSPKIQSIAVMCTDTTLIVGETTNCTAECTYLVVNSSGQQIITAPQRCQDLIWSSSNTGVVTVDQTGLVTATGVCPSAAPCANIAGTADNFVDSEAFNVVAATVTCSVVYPLGTGVPDQVPDADCEPSTDFATSAPAGVDVPFRAAAQLNSGQLCYAPTAPANQVACPANLVTFTSSNVTTASFANPANGVARTNAIGTAAITATGSTNQVDLTVTAPVLNAQLCVQAATPVGGCQDLTAADTFASACAVTAVPTLATGGAPFAFRARALFNLGTAVAQICDVTQDPATTWSIQDVGSNTAANPMVNNTAPNKGQVSPGNAATNGATVQASYVAGAVTASGMHDFNVVVNTVIASNSLVASAVPFGPNPDDPNYATRAACVGSFDLVDGLAEPPGLPAQDRLYAVLRRCQGGAAGADCAPAQLSDTPEDVTNAEATNVPPAPGTIVWGKQIGYWDGSQCVQPPDPTGLATVVGDVGDLDATLPPPSRYSNGAAFTGMGDGRIFNKGAATPRDNGVAVSNGGLSLGTVCITATYAEGGASTTDGITMIVLPVTNDSLLTDPDATAAIDLCNTLVPLLLLGSSPDGANGLVIQALGAVSNILNPLLTGLDAGLNTEGLLTQVITALNPITGPLSAAALTPILEAANEGVFTPINCLLNSILLALNPNAPPAQACP